MPKPRPTASVPAPAAPSPDAPTSSTAPAGERTIVLRVPADLAAWASAQARKEGTDVSKRLRGFLRQWQADVQAAEVAAQAQRQAEINAAVAAALKAKGKSRRG